MNETLVNRIRECASLPSMPAIAMQVLDLAQKANVDMAEIARIISRDPALSGKILRTVNSSFYARSQNVGTISHALVILGLQSVKTLVLGFSLVNNLTKNKSKGFKHLVYWKRSIYGATAARTIAAKLTLVQQEEAFLAALLQDIGMLVLDSVLGEEYGSIHARVKTHGELAVLETTAIGMDHAEVAGMLAGQWKLPPVLTIPMSHHHASCTVADPSLRRLAQVVEAAGRCADVFVDEQPAAAISGVRQFCVKEFGLSEADCDTLLEDIGNRTREVASLFEINIGTTADYDSVLKKANEALIEITLQSQQQATELQQQASTLAEQNQQLKLQATTDALTGLSNRARLDQFLREQFAASLAQGKPLSILLLDVDKFKSINDQHGHPTGDEVLRALGKMLRVATRAQDLAARYGGEELVLILPGTTRATAAATAESIRRAIASRPVLCGDAKLSVTASIGVATLEAGAPFTQCAHLVKAADLAVYAAKHAGRNCVRVFSAPKAAAKPAA